MEQLNLSAQNSVQKVNERAIRAKQYIEQMRIHVEYMT